MFTVGFLTLLILVLILYLVDISDTPSKEVIVSPFGIFCIEYKAHVGYIFGSEKNQNWTQCKYDGKHKLYNPLLQNYKHIKALELLLGRNVKAPIHSLVVFTNAKIVQVDSKKVLSNASELEDILDYHMTPVYTPEEYGKICRVLALAHEYSYGRLDQHVGEPKQYMSRKTAQQTV